jgi:hypothetical protein
MDFAYFGVISKWISENPFNPCLSAKHILSAEPSFRFLSRNITLTHARGSKGGVEKGLGWVGDRISMQGLGGG